MEKNEENWLAKYTALREYVEAHGHLTDRLMQLNHWWKYQKKKRKEIEPTHSSLPIRLRLISFYMKHKVLIIKYISKIWMR